MQGKDAHFIEDHVEEYICGSEIRSEFLNQDQNNINHKRKIDEYEYIKSKDFNSEQLTYMTDGTGERCLQCPKINNELMPQENPVGWQEKQRKPTQEKYKGFRQFRGEIQIAKKHTKRCHFTSNQRNANFNDSVIHFKIIRLSKIGNLISTKY